MTTITNPLICPEVDQHVRGAHCVSCANQPWDHGTYHTYRRGCRCRDCRDEKNKKDARNVARRRERERALGVASKRKPAPVEPKPVLPPVDWHEVEHLKPGFYMAQRRAGKESQ